jgi:hypothetical protein
MLCLTTNLEFIQFLFPRRLIMQFRTLAISAILAIATQGFATVSQATPYRADSALNLVDYVISQQHELQAAQPKKATSLKACSGSISTKDSKDIRDSLSMVPCDLKEQRKQDTK